MRRRLDLFPEILNAEIDLKTGRTVMHALDSFNQYVALEHSIEDGGGAIQMFHPRYLNPQVHHAALGTRDRSPEAIAALENALKALPGVRSVSVDPERWFTNEKGLEVGGAVLFADKDPKLELAIPEAAKKAGFIWEAKDHGGHGGGGADDHDEWSEMNHAFSGVCLLALVILGVLQLAIKQPPAIVRFGPVFIWLALFVFLFVRSDRGAWPLGPVSWWDSFRDWDTAQHRAGIGMILAIAIGDYVRIKRGTPINPALGKWGVLVIGVAGSAMLFTHLHTTIDPAHYAIVNRMNVQHLGMATSALGFALSKFVWETWRTPRNWGQYLWLIFLGMLGMFLTLYVE